MDSFGSDFSAGGSGGKIDTGTIMEQVKVQIAVANAQELLQRMTDKCFKKCIGKPGSVLDNSEQKCIAMCMDRYMDAWNTVSRTYNSRLQRERARMWESQTWALLSSNLWYTHKEDAEDITTRYLGYLHFIFTASGYEHFLGSLHLVQLSVDNKLS